VSINRQHRRQLQRQGQESGAGDDPNAPEDRGASDAELAHAAVTAPIDGVDGDGGAVRTRTDRGAPAPVRHRVAPRQFLHEVNVELRKVAWPTRAETINYSTVVFITLAVLMAMIFGLDLVFTKLAGFLFNP
jgi:preprotein translocase subunit SecE